MLRCAIYADWRIGDLLDVVLMQCLGIFGLYAEFSRGFLFTRAHLYLRMAHQLNVVRC